MKVVYFFIVRIAKFRLVFLKFFNSGLSAGDYVSEFLLTPLELLQLELYLLIFLPQNLFHFLPLILQIFDELRVMLLHGLYVYGMQADKSLLHIV